MSIYVLMAPVYEGPENVSCFHEKWLEGNQPEWILPGVLQGMGNVCCVVVLLNISQACRPKHTTNDNQHNHQVLGLSTIPVDYCLGESPIGFRQP